MPPAPVPESSSGPNPFGPMEMARTLAFLFVAGGSAVLLTLAFGSDPRTNVTGMAAIGIGAIVVGPALLAIGRRLSVNAVACFLILGQTCITGVVYFDGPGSVFAAFYVWVGAQAFLYLSRRAIVVQMVLMGIAYAWVLQTGADMTTPVQHWIAAMGATVALGILVGDLRSRLVATLDRLRDIARTDDLTGIANRRAFLERFDEELAQAVRQVRPLTLLIGDIDGFKLVNDRLGHPAGDRVLRRLADTLAEHKRLGDVLARMGGEEFGLLLSDTGEEDAVRVAERMLTEVREAFADDEIPITISFGLATYPTEGQDRSGLLRAADQALYHAKEAGRDRVVVYDPEASDALRDRPVSDTSDMQLATVLGLAEALDIRDNGTGEHSRSVARYAKMMAAHMGLEPAHVERIELAGLLHDVGKIGISDRVLTKPGPLDDEEWAQMRTHPQIGARLLSHPELADLRRWIVAHHERLDGRGYPFGLDSTEIPLEARILSVADAYEAMTADRVYRKKMAQEAARAELIGGAGEQFDGEAVVAFIEALDERSSEEMLVQGA